MRIADKPVKAAALFAALIFSRTGLAPASHGIGENPLQNVYFGATHVHTAYSLDAFLGGTRQTPGDALRVGLTISYGIRPERYGYGHA